jgi:hypothetical protein
MTATNTRGRAAGVNARIRRWACVTSRVPPSEAGNLAHRALRQAGGTPSVPERPLGHALLAPHGSLLQLSVANGLPQPAPLVARDPGTSQ